MRRLSKILCLIAIACILPAWLDPLRDMVSNGNGQYHAKKYAEARTSYTQAEKYTTSSEQRQKLSFNQGNVGHMLEEYDKAIAEYNKALQSEDKDVQKKAFFNLGNTYVKMEKYEDAVNAYINALRIDPNYEKAKKNLEYLLMDKKDQKQQEKNQDQNKDNQQKNDKNKDKQNEPNEPQDQQQRVKLNKEQIKNILDSMKNNPVRRHKGKGLQKDAHDKDW